MAAVRRKKRPYNAAGRQEAAAATRRSILDAARRTFVERGYPATTMASIAQGAGVALDTIYATVGNKPALFRLLVESAVSGSDEPVAALERDYVRAIQGEKSPRKKLAIYARAIAAIHPRLAALFRGRREQVRLRGGLPVATYRQVPRRSRGAPAPA